MGGVIRGLDGNCHTAFYSSGSPKSQPAVHTRMRGNAANEARFHSCVAPPAGPAQLLHATAGRVLVLRRPSGLQGRGRLSDHLITVPPLAPPPPRKRRAWLPANRIHHTGWDQSVIGRSTLVHDFSAIPLHSQQRVDFVNIDIDLLDCTDFLISCPRILEHLFMHPSGMPQGVLKFFNCQNLN